ncbi:unnamed protein product, partial [Protopolystoma xenopodis]
SYHSLYCPVSSVCSLPGSRISLDPCPLPICATRGVIHPSLRLSDILIQLLESLLHDDSGITDLHLANQRQSVLGVKVEQALTRLVLENPRLIRLGMDFDTAHARVQVREHLKQNMDRATRLSRKQ